MLDNIQTIIINACTIWLNNLVPSILPFYIITDLLVNYGFIDVLKFLLIKPLYKLFKLSECTAFVIIFSMLTGFPSSAKYIKSLIKEDLISTAEANKIIRFCHFSNPLFIINTIGSNLLGNKTLGLFILLSHFLSNFIIAFFLKSKSISNKTITFKQEKFGLVLTNSILNTFNSLLIILGNIITFQLLTNIIFNYFSFDNNIKFIINSIIEISSGIVLISTSTFNPYVKALFITSILSFGGLCIHSQVYGILSDTKVEYKNYLIGRIMQAIIAPLILLILLFAYRI